MRVGRFPECCTIKGETKAGEQVGFNYWVTTGKCMKHAVSLATHVLDGRSDILIIIEIVGKNVAKMGDRGRD